MSCGREYRETCRCPIDGERPLSLTVLECVSKVDGREPETLPPLHEAINPEALNNLFHGRDFGEVTFTYLDYEITVNSDAITTTQQVEDQPMTAD
ncbi:HalOD1 output domain-containing protein [Halorussus sp. AFM4]|uniref:HalOD1 output domain-containing protein n=1 Tax=Halorussus sp. AFM4 TaxID=3421651 RepID=UPI003EBE740E